MAIDYDVLLDATQHDCPVPTIQTKDALDLMSSGQILKVITSKEGTVRNIRTFVANNHCELMSEFSTDEGYVFLIRKL
ncbi:MAG: sulfurtransferase TusA family protein [Sulfuriferula sp.]